MYELSDKELIELFSDEKTREEAFSVILNRYTEKLYWHIRKIVLIHDDTDDVLQNVFIKVWKNLLNFREEASLFTWLYRIATNEALSFLETKKRRRIFLKNESDGYLFEPSADPYFEGSEIEEKLQKAIKTLPEKQKLVFNMKYFDDMKYEEMSRILETSVGALKASYHHAVKKIEAFLKIN